MAPSSRSCFRMSTPYHPPGTPVVTGAEVIWLLHKVSGAILSLLIGITRSLGGPFFLLFYRWGPSPLLRYSLARWGIGHVLFL